MGLTIHYDLKTELTLRSDLLALVESLRQYARDLPFQEVGERLEFEGPDADFEQGDRQDAHRWFKIQARQYVDHVYGHDPVTPRQVIGFSTCPGVGCEQANFGFCRYPATINVRSAGGRTQRLASGLDGWRWSSCCKTQYASNPKLGGVANFLRSHLCVVKMLDFLRATGVVTVEVHDESDYWVQRDLGRLATAVGQWNEFVAAFAGQLKDQAERGGVIVESAIAEFANYEHLEAKGLERLGKLRRQLDPD